MDKLQPSARTRKLTVGETSMLRHSNEYGGVQDIVPKKSDFKYKSRQKSMGAIYKGGSTSGTWNNNSYENTQLHGWNTSNHK